MSRTIKTWIELEFEAEYDYQPGSEDTRDCPGDNEQAEIISLRCVDPRVTGTLEIHASLAGRTPEVQKEVNKLLEGIEEDCLKDAHDSAEDPRI